MRIKKMLKTSLVIGTALMVVSCGKPDNKDAAESPFSIFATNLQGERLEGTKSEKDGEWYLFVPSTQDVSELTVHYTGTVTGTSVGQTDAENSMIQNAFEENKDEIEVTTKDGGCYTVTVMQSTLPSLQIYLKDVTLEELHQDKSKKYKNNTVILADPTGQYDMKAENCVEIKGRGNSTWDWWDKKPYQIKFEDKTSVMGMGKAKKWVLLANAADDSMMRNQLFFQMAKQLGGKYVPSFEYVDLWIDGDFRGIYLLGEKIEIGTSRLNLIQPDGALFEQDVAKYEEEDYWFYSETLKKPFSLKDIVEEETSVVCQAMGNFQTVVDELMTLLYDTPPEKITLEQLSQMIDVDSFATYYLVNEFFLNREDFESSFFWYQDGAEDVLHLGPFWDYDTCMGNDGIGPDGRYGYNHTLFAYLLEIPEFRERAEVLYEQYRPIFMSVIPAADCLKEKIAASAEMDNLKWNLLGKANPKPNMADYQNTFDEAVTSLKEWLKARENQFMIAEDPSVSVQINEDCTELDIVFKADQACEKVQFGVWSREYRKQMYLRTDAEQVDDVWHGKMDLTMFDADGLYQVDVYVDGNKTADAIGRVYAEKAAEQTYVIQAELIEDEKMVRIILEDHDPHENVRFAVWSEVNGQDDLEWCFAERNSQGIWEYIQDIEKLSDDGVYYIHAYGDKSGASELLNVTILNIEH